MSNTVRRYHNFKNRPTIETHRDQITAKQYHSGDFDADKTVYYHNDETASYGIDPWIAIDDVYINLKDNKIGLMLANNTTIFVDQNHTLFIETSYETAKKNLYKYSRYNRDGPNRDWAPSE